MAEDDDIENEEGEGEEEEKVGGKKKFLVIILLVLLLGGGGAGAYFMGVFGGGDAEKTEQAEGGEEGGEEGKLEGDVPADAGPVYYELPEFLVNLSATGKKVSFLKMKVTLELENQLMVPKIDVIKPRIQDAFNTYLRELRTSDLAGSAGIYRLREELLLRVNKVTHPQQVKDILFSEIIVQ